MDALKRLHFASRFMTSQDWEKYIVSDDYMWARARIDGYQGAYMDKLIAAATRKTKEAWAIALDMAERIVGEELASLPADITRPPKAPLVQEFAEFLLRDQHMVPPTYSKRVVCETCGPMMAPDSYETETPTCPWCAK